MQQNWEKFLDTEFLQISCRKLWFLLIVSSVDSHCLIAVFYLIVCL